ncbi:MarR family transcriptional regulator [soil metagenome]
MTRTESLRALEHEVGVMIRRVRRVIGERARAVHPDLQPASYLILTSVAESGPVRASVLVELFDMDKGAISRQIRHLLDLGLLVKEPDPADARAWLVSLSADAVHRLADVAAHRHQMLDEQLGEWSAEDLEGFVSELSRYNGALNRAHSMGEVG